MAFEFNADEVLEMAEQIELNGARFYQKAAEMMEEPAMRKLFLRLAAWEEGHQQLFASMRAELTEAERRPTVFDPEDVTGMYLRAMADGHVFDLRADQAGRLSGRETAREILDLAIEQEKNSIVFYLGLKEIVPERLGKERVEQIIREERRHIGVLNEQIEVLAD